MYELQGYLEVAREAAFKGLVAAHQSNSSVVESHGHDVTTEADLKSNIGVLDVLRQRTPRFAILSEETKNGYVPAKDETYWVVDPQDGSNNRSRDFPYWSVSVSLVGREKVLVSAVATLLYGGIPTLFHAISGYGMYKNDFHVNVSKRPNFVGATVAFDNSYTPSETSEVVKRLSVLSPMPWLKNFGSAVLTTAEVAAGTWDAHYHWAFKAWDIAAALLMIPEAGGIIIDLETLKPATLQTTKAVCGNKLIVQKILDQVQPV